MKVFLQIFMMANHLVFLFAGDNNQTVDCILQAVHLIAKRKIAIEFAKDSQDLATDILLKVNIPVVLNAKEHRKETGIEFRTPIDVLLLLGDARPAKIVNETLWNGDTRFIIITRDVETVEEYFQQFWKFKVINVFGMVTTEGNATLYSFLPYGKENCTKAEPTIVDVCVEGKLQNEGAALEDKMRIKNMNQCPVNITISEVRPGLIFEPEKGRKNSSTATGFEGNLMVEISKVYNFNVTFKIAEDGIGWGWVHPSPRGAIGDLYRGLTDITVGLQAPFMERYEYFDFAANYNLELCITFAVPQGHGPKKAIWLTTFVLEFTYHTWISVLVSLVLIFINVWLIRRFLYLDWFRSNTEIALFILSSCFGMPIKIPHFLSAKTAAIFWISFTFIITVAYKASMGSKLTVPPPDAEINTFQELLDSDLQIMGLRNQIQMLVSKKEWPYTELLRRYKYTNDTVDIIVDRMVNGEKVTYLFPRSTFYYYSQQNRRARGRVHALEDCVYPYYPYTLMKKFSPFTRRVSQTIRRLEESGIMQMWRAEYVKKIPAPKKPFFKLSMKQMFGVFCFLLVGYVVALCTFLCEIYFVFGFVKSLTVLPAGYSKFNKE